MVIIILWLKIFWFASLGCIYSEPSTTDTWPFLPIIFSPTQKNCCLAALYFVAVATFAAFTGQHIVRRMIAILGRASLIIFILAGTIFISAISLGNIPRHKITPLKCILSSRFNTGTNFLRWNWNGFLSLSCHVLQENNSGISFRNEDCAFSS